MPRWRRDDVLMTLQFHRAAWPIGSGVTRDTAGYSAAGAELRPLAATGRDVRESAYMPHGAILWQSEHDKLG